MSVSITPPALSHRIGETIAVVCGPEGTAAVEGDSLSLHLFDGNVTYSAALDTQLAGPDGTVTFLDVVIPSFAIGNTFLIVRHAVSLVEDFSDPFELLPAAPVGRHHCGPRLGLGLGLGL